MAGDRCPICRQPGREPGIPHKLDCPRARYHLTLPAKGPAPERPSTEAEREARIRADERARIVAELRDIAEHHPDDEVAHYFGRVATVIETEFAPETPHDHP